MSFNPIVRGLNALSKFIARGYGQSPRVGTKIRFCRAWSESSLPMTISSVGSLDLRLLTENSLDMKVSTA